MNIVGALSFAVYFGSVVLGHPLDVAAWLGTSTMLYAIYNKIGKK